MHLQIPCASYALFYRCFIELTTGATIKERGGTTKTPFASLSLTHRQQRATYNNEVDEKNRRTRSSSPLLIAVPIIIYSVYFKFRVLKSLPVVRGQATRRRKKKKKGKENERKRKEGEKQGQAG